MLTCASTAAYAAVRTELVEAVFAFCFGGPRTSRGLPGGNSLSFCVAKKKVSKKKGAPTVCVPSASLRGNLRCSVLGAYRRGWETGSDSAVTRFARHCSPSWAWYLLSLPKPVGPGRGAQVKADQGSRLFEPKASSSETQLLPSTAGCPRSAAKGVPDHRVAFLLGTFLWRSKEKCFARRGETRLVGRPHCTNKPTWIPDQVRDDSERCRDDKCGGKDGLRKAPC